DPTLLEAHRLKVARARAKKKAWINNLKLERGCELCGYRKCAAALEFHHLDPASKELHIGLRYNCSNARLKAEIDKCMVVCANCHRELHYGHV
ncbi:MAG: hypothetical protein GTN93_23400, partial [Anaerolineae bacterium]|nr:hypothetical protein [Anaerolineae bacterium]